MNWKRLQAKAMVGAGRALADFADHAGRAADAKTPAEAAGALFDAAVSGFGMSVRLMIANAIGLATGEQIEAPRPRDASGKVISIDEAWKRAARAKRRWER